jgi:predicted ATPase
MELAVRVEGAEQAMDYSIAFGGLASDVSITAETLRFADVPRDGSKQQVIERSGRKAKVRKGSEPGALVLEADARSPVLTAFGMHPPHPTIARMTAALGAIDVHIPFEVMPMWAAKKIGRRSLNRESSTVQPANRLQFMAANLADAFMRLRNEPAAHWQQTMELVRLGLGQDIDNVNLTADAAGGQHALSIRYKTLPTPVPASGLSDGTIAFLAFVALYRLSTQRSAIVFDEPELHLHPTLLTRVVAMFEDMARSCPVLLTTHSDRLLDALSEPAKSAVLCELDGQRATRLLRPDAAVLAKWRQDYNGLGEVRAAGHQRSVMTRETGS